MKNKLNRKSYNYKPRHKQRTKSERNERWCKVNRAFTKIRQRQFRAKCRCALDKIICGLEVEIPQFRKTDSWDGC